MSLSYKEGTVLYMRAILFSLWLAIVPSLCHAVGPESETLDSNPDWRQASFDVSQGRFREALALLHRLRQAEPHSADVAGQIGFVYRKLGVMDASKRFYEAALALDRHHLASLSYQGQWFLETGDVASARVNLDTLAGLCGTCSAWRDLDQALSARLSR